MACHGGGRHAPLLSHAASLLAVAGTGGGSGARACGAEAGGGEAGGAEAIGDRFCVGTGGFRPTNACLTDCRGSVGLGLVGNDDVDAELTTLTLGERPHMVWPRYACTPPLSSSSG